MSSMDLEAPSPKLILAAIIVVVGLHILTAMALVAIKTPELKIEAKKDTPPIEIELVSLPAAPEAEVAPKQEPAPQIAKQQPPVPKAKSIAPPKPEAPAKPVVREEPVLKEKTTPKPASTVPVKVPVKKPKAVEKPRETPKATVVKPKVDTSVADEQHKIIAAKAERAAQAAQAQAAREAQVQAAQEAQANRDAQAQADHAAAVAKAAKEAAEAATSAKAAAEKAAAASNTPVNFTASAANWASTPNFSFPDRAARRANSGDTFTVVLTLRVNKQGGIDSVRVAKSSGNTALDREAQRQVRSGKFKPFTNENGVPVVGNVTLPIAYKVP